jgi:hypothetical protein
MPAKRNGSNVKIVRRTLADGTVKEYRYDLAARAAEKEREARNDALHRIALEFFQSPEFKKNGEAWQKVQRYHVSIIETKLGWMTFGDLNEREARGDFYELRDSLSDRPTVADKVMNTLRTLLDFAYERGKIDHNHASGIPWLVEGNRSRADIIVKPEWEEAILKAATPEFRRACIVAKYSCARIGDMCRFHDSMVDADGWLVFQPAKTLKKTGAWVYLPLPVLEPLYEALAPAIGSGDFLLKTDHGRPWQVSNLQFNWTETKKRAGLGDINLHWHDWRGTGETAMLEAGCTEVEAKAVLGHALVHGAARKYAARSREYALNAFRKWNARVKGGGEVVRLFG